MAWMGAAIGAGASLLGGMINQGYAQSNAQQSSALQLANQLSLDRQAPSAQVAGDLAAGINPMVPFMGGNSMGQMSMPSMATPDVSQIMANVASATAAFAGAKAKPVEAAAQTSQAESASRQAAAAETNANTNAVTAPEQAHAASVGAAASARQAATAADVQPRLAGACEVQAGSSASQAATQSRMVDVTVTKFRQEVANMKSEQGRIEAATSLLREQQGVAASEQLSMEQTRALQEATIANLRRDGLLKDADIEAIRATKGVGRVGRELGHVTDILRPVNGGR